MSVNKSAWEIKGLKVKWKQVIIYPPMGPEGEPSLGHFTTSVSGGAFEDQIHELGPPATAPGFLCSILSVADGVLAALCL